MRYRSPKQQSASRANGAHSQGPVTPEGKSQSSQNSRKHGFYAKAILLPGESRAEFDRLAAQLHDRFLPADPLEAMLVQRMVLAQWRLVRIWAFERAGMATASAAKSEDAPHPESESQDPAARDLTAFQSLHGQGRAGSVLQLSELRYGRQFERAVALLQRLRVSAPIRIDETNLASASFYGPIPKIDQPTPVPRRPARLPKPSQTDPPPSRNQPDPT